MRALALGLCSWPAASVQVLRPTGSEMLSPSGSFSSQLFTILFFSPSSPPSLAFYSHHPALYSPPVSPHPLHEKTNYRPLDQTTMASLYLWLLICLKYRKEIQAFWSLKAIKNLLVLLFSDVKIYLAQCVCFSFPPKSLPSQKKRQGDGTAVKLPDE